MQPIGTKVCVARWETRGGRYWLELYFDRLGFTFDEDNGGGNLGNVTLAAAFQRMTEIVNSRKVDGINLQPVIVLH